MGNLAMAITERRGKQQNCRKGRSIPYRRGMKSLVFQISERGLRVGPMDQRKVGCGAVIKNKRNKAGASPVCSHLLSSCRGRRHTDEWEDGSTRSTRI